MNRDEYETVLHDLRWAVDPGTDDEESFALVQKAQAAYDEQAAEIERLKGELAETKERNLELYHMYREACKITPEGAALTSDFNRLRNDWRLALSRAEAAEGWLERIAEPWREVLGNLDKLENGGPTLPEARQSIRAIIDYLESRVSPDGESEPDETQAKPEKWEQPLGIAGKTNFKVGSEESEKPTLREEIESPLNISCLRDRIEKILNGHSHWSHAVHSQNPHIGSEAFPAIIDDLLSLIERERAKVGAESYPHQFIDRNRNKGYWPEGTPQPHRGINAEGRPV